MTRIRFSANLGLLWTDRPLPDAVRAAAAAGFDAVELHWPYDTDARLLRSVLEEVGLPVVSLNTPRGDLAAGENGLTAVPGREVAAREAIDQAVDYARAVGATAVHVMAGVAEGPAAHRRFVDALRETAVRAPDLTLLIEPLNAHDAPGYLLRTVDQARRVVEEVGSPAVRIMFDCYHVQRTEADLLRRFAEVVHLVGHVQIAAIPDRGAPDHGEVDYARVLPVLVAAGWHGAVGAEYRPAGATDDSLDWLAVLRTGR